MWGVARLRMPVSEVLHTSSRRNDAAAVVRRCDSGLRDGLASCLKEKPRSGRGLGLGDQRAVQQFSAATLWRSPQRRNEQYFCTAKVLSRLCLSWVIRDGSTCYPQSRHVCFTPKADKQADVSGCLLCAISGCEQSQQAVSVLDHFVGGCQLGHCPVRPIMTQPYSAEHRSGSGKCS
jgi:hypothetical protein